MRQIGQRHHRKHANEDNFAAPKWKHQIQLSVTPSVNASKQAKQVNERKRTQKSSQANEDSGREISENMSK